MKTYEASYKVSQNDKRPIIQYFDTLELAEDWIAETTQVRLDSEVEHSTHYVSKTKYKKWEKVLSSLAKIKLVKENGKFI